LSTAKRSIRIFPIGVVKSVGEVSEIELLPKYVQGLKGVRETETLQILYWMHNLTEDDRKVLLAHPRGDRARPKRGVFVLRSPLRPNPIGSTVVELVRREKNSLFVRGLDALEGSPVIDIKCDPNR
jgi:tRNA-Thr(GGU) m(6)t(6)A37 methyltransferase TsaA